jgi:hypothetical protein
MQSDQRKTDERIIAEMVAAKLGGVARLAESDPPDAYIDDVPGEPGPIPVEIVRAEELPPGELPDPRRGAPAAKAKAQLERDIAKLLDDGAPGVFSTIRDGREPVAVAAVPGAAKEMGLRMQELDPRVWLIAAVRPKCAMQYTPGTILAVDVRFPWRVDADDLAALGAFVAQQGHPFQSVWVCSRYRNEAHRVPFPRPPALDSHGS